jgi:hypothetical protein
MSDPFNNQRNSRGKPGLDQFYKAKIVARNDPERLGRLRCRVIGFFGDEIKDEELPWYYPKAGPAWAAGGMFWIPPLDEYVWTQFEEGDWEYGTWSPGFWGKDETRQGKTKPDALVKARLYDTSWYGSQVPWDTGPLRKDKGETDHLNAPNNFGFCSPLLKRFEFDDRRFREKFFLADRHDNFLWINSEDGVTTLETAGGNRSPDFFPRGITFSSNARQGKLSTQMYSFAGWRFTLDDLAVLPLRLTGDEEEDDPTTATGAVGEWAAPSGNKIRINDAAGARSVEIWCGDMHLVFNEFENTIQLTTATGVGLNIDTTAATVRVSDSQYFRMLFAGGDTEIVTPGTLRTHSGGDTVMTANGQVRIDGTMGIYLNCFPFTSPGGVPLSPVFTKPETMPKVDRAPDYPYYAAPEKVPEAAPGTPPPASPETQP